MEGEHQVGQVAERLGLALGWTRFIRSNWRIHEEPSTRNTPIGAQAPVGQRVARVHPARGDPRRPAQQRGGGGGN